MTSEITTQEKKNTEDKILDCLILLREHFNRTNRQIAEELGLHENYVSRLFAKNAKGSVQLLKALMLLIHTYVYPRLNWPNADVEMTITKRAEAARISVQDFLIQCAIRYGDKTMDELIIGATTRDVVMHKTQRTVTRVTSSTDAADILKRLERAEPSRKKKEG